MRRFAIVLLGMALVTAGCSMAGPHAPAAADLSGEWTGLWRGYGIDQIRREAPITAQLHQKGNSGSGLLILNDTGAVSALPLAVRQPGMVGVRVVFDVSGSHVVMAHELGSQFFLADFTIQGDRLVGHIPGSVPDVQMVLLRVPAPGGGVLVPATPVDVIAFAESRANGAS